MFFNELYDSLDIAVNALLKAQEKLRLVLNDLDDQEHAANLVHDGEETSVPHVCTEDCTQQG